MIDIDNLTFLGKSIGGVFGRCISNNKYSALLIVDSIRDCMEFADAIRAELDNDPLGEFSQHVERVWTISNTFCTITFKNGSKLRVMHYHEPPRGSWPRGENYNCVVDISNHGFEADVEQWIQSVIKPYRYIPSQKTTREVLDSTESNDIDAEKTCIDMLNEYLDGFTIKPSRKGY